MRQFIRDFNQLAIFILIVVAIIEFINHGASWDGLYKAHQKHINRANSQILMGE